MPRPRRDGKPPRTTQRVKLTELFVQKVKPSPARTLYYDTAQAGLVLAVEPSGFRSYKFVYGFGGRGRWYAIGNARGIGLKEAREIARQKYAEVIKGTDVQAEKRAARKAGTFGELAERYLTEYAKRKLKSADQSEFKINTYLLPRWKHLQVLTITRADVRSLHRDLTDKGSPISANQAVAMAGAIFKWAIKNEVVPLPANPAHGIETNRTQSRERVLSEREIPLFWSAFDEAGLVCGSALKMILLTGQRPGEIRHMLWEQIEDGWWQLPGKPNGSWPGTKNEQSHSVWLSKPAQELLAELNDGRGGYVFPGRGGNPVGKLDAAMRDICATLKVNEKATPHDLRRTHGTTVTGLGFTRDQMNRLQNHKEGGIGSVYDRHHYADENRRIQEAVAAKIMALVTRQEPDSNVVALKA